MAKKVVVPILKKPMKRDNKKKQFLGKFLQYLTSDNYMFASLISTNPTITFAPDLSGVVGNVATKGQRDVGETKLKDYINSDCYMYAPLIEPQPWLKASQSISGAIERRTESMKKWSEDRPKQKEKIIIEDKVLSSSPPKRNAMVSPPKGNDTVSPPKRNATVTRRVSRKETVKNIVQSPSEPGKVPAKTRARRGGSRSNKVA